MPYYLAALLIALASLSTDRCVLLDGGLLVAWVTRHADVVFSVDFRGVWSITTAKTDL